MQVLTIDFETYWDKQFSLGKLTTEEYVRDPRFEVIGVAVAVNGGAPEWFSGTPEQTKDFLLQYDWAGSIALAHNAMFDMAILTWKFGITPFKIADTLSMGRALHTGDNISLSLDSLTKFYGVGVKGDEVGNAAGLYRKDFTPEHLKRYAEYCRTDVALTYKLFCAMMRGQKGPPFPPAELSLIDTTIRMFSSPVLEIETDVLEAHLEDVRAKKEKLMSLVAVDRKAIMSNPQFAALLEKLGVTPPMKISATTGKETYAFAKSDEAFLALQEHSDPRVQALVAARLGVKSTIEETRTERFLDIAARGTLPVPLLYYGAHTGRWSGSDKLNMQNLPRTSPLKKAIRAPEGYVLCNSDSSQIEARMLAWLAGCDTLMHFFRKNDEEIAAGVPKADMVWDPYKVMASIIFSVSREDITPDQRQVGKVGVLSCMYGIGWRKLISYARPQGIDMDDALANRVVDAYRTSFPEITKLWREGDDALAAMCFQSDTGLRAFSMQPEVLTIDADKQAILLPNGLALRYPELHWNSKLNTFAYKLKRGRSKLTKFLWGGSLAENYTQALARIVIGEQMAKVAKRYPIALTVHDAVLPVIPEHEAERGLVFVEEQMRARPKWADGLPLNCESKMGATYG